MTAEAGPGEGARDRYVAQEAVAPDLRSVARFLPRSFGLRFGRRPQRAVMEFFGRMGALSGVSDVPIAPGVSVRIHHPAGLTGRGPALLWLHGGGCVLGTAKQDDQFCRRLAYLAGVSVVAVDYRLVPEHPYPAPLEDCYTALAWLAKQSWIDPERIAIGGESAGGNYAAALAILARDRAEVQPVLQMLVYPMLDDRTGARPTGRPRIMWSETDNQRAWRWYLDGVDPSVAVPARRTDLAGLPPAWLGVGTLDLFLDETLDYARRLEAVGVPAHVELADGGFHAFDLIAPNAPTSLKFFASQCAHLRDALQPSTTRVTARESGAPVA